jgi:hypothetical protein
MPRGHPGPGGLRGGKGIGGIVGEPIGPVNALEEEPREIVYHESLAEPCSPFREKRSSRHSPRPPWTRA